MVVNGYTFEILDFYEAPPSHSSGFYILVNSFSFHSYFFFIVDKNQFIRTCDEHRRLFVFAFRDNLVTNDNLNSRDRTVARRSKFKFRTNQL